MAGQTVSALGDAVSITAMPLLVLFLTGSGALMGTVGALQLVPDLAFGTIGRANSYMEATLSLPFIVGPALAGVLAATIGPAPTLAIDAGSFAASAAGMLLVR